MPEEKINNGQDRSGEIRKKRRYTYRTRKPGKEARKRIAQLGGNLGTLGQARTNPSGISREQPRVGQDFERVGGSGGGERGRTGEIADEKRDPGTSQAAADAKGTAREETSSASQATAQASNFVAEQTPSEQRKTPRRAKSAPVVDLREETARKTVDSILNILNGIAASMVDPAAMMQESERGLIEPPFVRFVNRIEPAIIDKVSAASDPLSVAIGFAMWGNRVMQIWQAKNEQPKSEPTPQAATPNVADPAPAPQPTTPATDDKMNHNGANVSLAVTPRFMGGLVDPVI